MYIDDFDKGYVALILRGPGFSADYPISREDTILVLYAGLLAEKCHDEETTGKSAEEDLRRIEELKSEDANLDLDALRNASDVLIASNWVAVDKLARRVLKEEFREYPGESLPSCFSKLAACIRGVEIQRELAEFDIAVRLSGPCLAD